MVDWIKVVGPGLLQQILIAMAAVCLVCMGWLLLILQTQTTVIP